MRRAKFGKALGKAASPNLDVHTGFFLYASSKQRKRQDGQEQPCLHSVASKGASSKAKEELTPPNSDDTTLHADSTAVGQREKGALCFYQVDAWGGVYIYLTMKIVPEQRRKQDHAEEYSACILLALKSSLGK